jgi:hypothetical protein
LTIDESDEDEAFKKRYIEEVRMLCGVVIEMFGERQTTLLSPYFREMVLERAQKLQEKHQRIYQHLHVDNPGKPLEAPNA